MQAILLVVLAVVASCASTPAVPKAKPLLNYHENVGIKRAAAIKSNEEVYIQKLEAAGKPLGDNSNSRIVGGHAPRQNDFPFLGGLIITFMNLTGQSVCGSTLLSSSRLVTAARCWFDGRHQASMFEVVLGSEFLFFGGTRIYTNRVITHPGYIPEILTNDIAMIYLPINVYLSDSIKPVLLPTTNQLQNQFVGIIATTAGYGKTSDQQTGIPVTTDIQHVWVSIISVQECQAVYGPTFVQPTTICTSGDGFVGICEGDFGGPLVVGFLPNATLVGIASFVNANGCSFRAPSGFTRVTSFYSFIQQHM